MKNFKKIIACAMAVATLGVVSTAPMNVSAIAKVLGYDLNGNEITGNMYDELVGFDEDGNPIIVTIYPDDYDFNGPHCETAVGDSDTTVGDSNNLYDEPTNIRGDVNYDGKVNVIDVMTLRRYLLHLLEW